MPSVFDHMAAWLESGVATDLTHELVPVGGEIIAWKIMSVSGQCARRHFGEAGQRMRFRHDNSYGFATDYLVGNTIGDAPVGSEGGVQLSSENLLVLIRRPQCSCLHGQVRGQRPQMVKNSARSVQRGIENVEP